MTLLKSSTNKILIFLYFILLSFFSFNSYSQDSTSTPDSEIFITEIMPQFPGGQEQLKKYIKDNIRYPESNKRGKTKGRVYAKFTIGTDGSISQVTIVKGMNKETDREAIRLISNMPNWRPGTQNGKVVKVIYTLPIYFEY